MGGEEGGCAFGKMPQDAARAYWRFTLLWLIVGCSLGTLCALSLLSPSLLSGHPILGYGRLIAAHRAVMVHGLLFSAVFASAYALLPRLAQDLLTPRPSSVALSWFGMLVVLAGLLGILWGRGSGLEYSDLPTPVAFLFWLYLVGVAVDLAFLAARSRSLREHPSFGLLLAASMLPAVVYPFTLPDWWGVGLFPALRAWIGWRSIFLGSFVAAALGASLWTVGSGRSSTVLPRGPYVVGVALLVGLAPFVGIVHLLDAPVSPGLRAWGAFCAVVAGAALFLLVLVLWPRKPAGLPGALVLFGLTGLGATAVQGVLMVMRPLHSAFHFTSNTSAHAHLALGAVLTLFLACGLIVWPRLGMRRLHNAERAMPATAWLIGGLVLVFLFQTAAGIVQASAFGQGLSPTDWLPALKWLHLGVLAGGIASVIGSGMLAWIGLATLRAPQAGPIASTASPETYEPLPDGGEG